MSLVENLINQISTQGLNGITTPVGFDMNDDTFAKLLDKQMNLPTETVGVFPNENFGVPAGLIIEPIDGIEYTETVQDQMEIIGETKLSKEEYINQPIEFKDIDMGDHFSKLLKFNTETNSDFLNFAKKNATNAYNVFSKGFVSDMHDFIEDIATSL